MSLQISRTTSTFRSIRSPRSTKHAAFGGIKGVHKKYVVVSSHSFLLPSCISCHGCKLPYHQLVFFYFLSFRFVSFFRSQSPKHIPHDHFHCHHLCCHCCKLNRLFHSFRNRSLGTQFSSRHHMSESIFFFHNRPSSNIALADIDQGKPPPHV